MTEPATAIIFVPGIRPKPPVAEQKAQLRRCLIAGIQKVGGSAAEAERAANSFSVVGWSNQFYGHDADISIDLPGIERLLAGTDSPEQDEREARSLGWRVTSGMYAIGDRFPLLSNLFGTKRMDSRVAEIQRYFYDRGGKATAARSMVADALQAAWDKQQRVILIGHSFGSVIAYDTLWELCRLEGNPGKVDRFISMGSPLTMRRVRKHLAGVHRSAHDRYPANMRRWQNLAAVGEVTALDRKMAGYFGDMLRLGLTESIDDNLNLINQFRGADGLNVHKCYGYMASQTVGALIREAIPA
jgi:pimeloyl-ACP methyl ester carboxylesterase